MIFGLKIANLAPEQWFVLNSDDFFDEEETFPYADEFGQVFWWFTCLGDDEEGDEVEFGEIQPKHKIQI